MEHNLTQRRQGLAEKIPDIKKTLSMVEFLQDRRVSFVDVDLVCVVDRSRVVQESKGIRSDDDADELDEEDDPQGPITTTFELNDTLFAEAVLEETETVFLWLGVRVVSYVKAT
jgi:hypothetical protein